MARFVVGSVPYLNAKPLVKPLEWAGNESPVAVRFEVPSRLPAMLDCGEAAAIMVSSIHALSKPGRVAAGLSIGSHDQVASVRLFSRMPFEQIRTLALDGSSMTSNVLAQIVLRERYGASPVCESRPPSLTEMLSEFDACVMIGDNGMAADEGGLHVMDLGHEWRALTGLPFVWAVWFGRQDLTPELVAHLQRALSQSRRNWDRLLGESAMETGFSPEQCQHYLADIMDYRLETEHLEGFREFGRRAAAQGLIHVLCWPEIVQPEPALALSG